MSKGACRVIWLCQLCCHYHNCCGIRDHSHGHYSGSGSEHDSQSDSFTSTSMSEIYAEMERRGWVRGS